MWSRVLRRTPRGGVRRSRGGYELAATSTAAAVEEISTTSPVTGSTRVPNRRDQAGILADAQLDRLGDVGVFAQEGSRGVLALAEPLVTVGEVRPALSDDAAVDAQVKQVALVRDSLAVHDVELGLLEWRRDLVLDDLDARAVADALGALLERFDAADVHAHRCVELERAATGSGLRASRTSRRSSRAAGW